jgi:hypothetical protein
MNVVWIKSVADGKPHTLECEAAYIFWFPMGGGSPCLCPKGPAFDIVGVASNE